MVLGLLLGRGCSVPSVGCRMLLLLPPRLAAASVAFAVVVEAVGARTAAGSRALALRRRVGGLHGSLLPPQLR